MRLYTLFKAPPEQVLEWDITQIVGQHRWLGRVWTLVHGAIHIYEKSKPLVTAGATTEEKKLLFCVHHVIKNVTASMKIGTNTFNVAIAELMKLSNTLTDCSPATKTSATYYQGVRCLLLMLAPMAPHISAELWEALIQVGPRLTSDWAGTSEQLDLFAQPWPRVNSAYLQQEEVTVAFQVPGNHFASLQSRYKAKPEASSLCQRMQMRRQ